MEGLLIIKTLTHKKSMLSHHPEAGGGQGERSARKYFFQPKSYILMPFQKENIGRNLKIVCFLLPLK